MAFETEYRSYGNEKERCASTYLAAYFDLSDLIERYNNADLDGREFSALYSAHAVELKARNVGCYFKLSRKEKLEIKNCHEALKSVYTKLDDQVSLSQALFDGDHEIRGTGVFSRLRDSVSLIGSAGVCLTEGILNDLRK